MNVKKMIDTKMISPFSTECLGYATYARRSVIYGVDTSNNAITHPLCIFNGLPEAGGGGASADTSENASDAPEAAASDDDDDGDGDGEDDWRRSGPRTPLPSNGPAPLKRGIARNTGTRKAANHPTQPIDAMLWRLPTVLNHIPVSRSSWFAGVKAGLYPKPVRLGARAVAWRAEDIRTLVASFSMK